MSARRRYKVELVYRQVVEVVADEDDDLETIEERAWGRPIDLESLEGESATVIGSVEEQS